MPYLVSSIIAVVTAMIILLTRYESDDSAITAEIERTKSMFITVDGFVNTYIQSGGDMTAINFEKLYDDGILLGNIKMTKPTATGDDVTGTGFKSVLNFPKSEIKWHIIPIYSDDTLYSSSAGSGYKLFIDTTGNKTLDSKAGFSENFLAREICEKTLFGSIQEAETSHYDDAQNNFKITTTAKKDGKFICVVFK